MDHQIKWQSYVTRSLSLYKLDMYTKGLRSALKEYFNFDMDHVLIHGKGIECDWYTEPNEAKALGNLLLDYFLECIKSNKDPLMLFNKIQDDLVKTSAEISKIDTTSKEDLLDAYRQFMKRAADYQMVIWFPLTGEDALVPYTKNRFMQLTNDEKSWDIITEPFEPSVIQREFIDLLKVAEDYSDEKLKAHLSCA